MKKFSRDILLLTCSCIFLLLPAMSLSADLQTVLGEMSRFSAYRQNAARELKLSPDQAREFDALGDKFLNDIVKLYVELNKSLDDLKKTMAAAPADEAGVEKAVAEVNGIKDKLLAKFQDEWQQEMKLLTPLQQAQYLLIMEGWFKQNM